MADDIIQLAVGPDLFQAQLIHQACK